MPNPAFNRTRREAASFPVERRWRLTMPRGYLDPSNENIDSLARMWLAVEQLVDEEYGVKLTIDLSSLELLQRLLDDDAVDRGIYALQCLGCVLGRIMAAHLEGIDWCVIEDEQGATLCLRYSRSTLCVFPLTMISKRIERDEPVSVQSLYRDTERALGELRQNVDGPG